MRKFLVACLLLAMSLGGVSLAQETTASSRIDMPPIIEMGRYEFDFLPWYTHIDDAVAAFGLSADAYLRTDLPTGAVIEFAYPNALTGENARTQLLFEQMTYYNDNGNPIAKQVLTGIRTIDTFADIDGLFVYIDAINDRFVDMKERKVLDMQLKRAVGYWPSVKDDLSNDPTTATRFSVIGAEQFPDADGIERRAEMSIHVGSSTHYREYLTSDAPYFAMYTYTVEIPD